MTRRNNHPEGIAHAREEGKRIQKLNEKGLCQDCGSNPQNPHIAGKVCLSCWNDTPQIGCDVKNCPNSTDGHFRQAALCSIHLADTIHKQHDEYLETKSRVDEEKQRLKDKADDLEVGLPNNSHNDYKQLTSEQQDVYDEWIAVKHRERGLAQLKNDIKKAMDQIEQPFPEEYKVFG